MTLTPEQWEIVFGVAKPLIDALQPDEVDVAILEVDYVAKTAKLDTFYSKDGHKTSNAQHYVIA